MKLFGAFLTVAVMSLTAQANTTDSVFGNNSVLPKQLQTQMLDLLTEKCSMVVESYGLRETETIIISEELGAESETQYETVLRSRYHYDFHPRTEQIKMLSSKVVTHVGRTVYTIHQLNTDAGCEL